MIGRNGKIETIEYWKWNQGESPKFHNWLRNIQELGYKLTFRTKGAAILINEDGYLYTKLMVVAKEA